MGYRRYYVTAIIDIDDKYDFETKYHFSNHSVIRDSDVDAFSIVADQIPNCETICSLTKIDDGIGLNSIKSDIAPLGKHLIDLKRYYMKLKDLWYDFKEAPPA